MENPQEKDLDVQTIHENSMIGYILLIFIHIMARHKSICPPPLYQLALFLIVWRFTLLMCKEDSAIVNRVLYDEYNFYRECTLD